MMTNTTATDTPPPSTHKPPTIAEVIAAKAKAPPRPPAPPTTSKGDEPATNAQAGTTAATLSVFERANRPTANGTLELREFVRRIKEGDYETAVGKVRRAVARGKADGLTPAEIKKRVGPVKMAELEAVTLSGCVTHGGRQRAFDEGRFAHSGWLQIDLDAKDMQGADEEATRDRLGKDPHILTAHLSPTGEGVKAIMLIPVCLTPAEHLRAFLAAEAYILATYGLQIDKATKDPTRVCFVTHDPGATWNGGTVALPIPDEAEPVKRDLPPAPRPRTTTTARSGGGGIVIHGGSTGADLTLADLAAMLKHIPRPDHDEWVKIASGAWNHFGDAATAALQAWMPEEKAGEYQYKFAHRLEDVRIGTVIHHAQAAGYVPPVSVRAVSLRITPEQAAQVAEAVASGKFLAALEDDHRGLAQAYADTRFSSRCFSHDELSWRFFAGGIWKRDSTGETLDDLQTALTPLLVESANEAIRKLDPEKNKERINSLRKRAKCLFNLRTARATLENAQVLPEFRATRGDFDQAPHLLAIENGVVDFTAGTVRDHSPADMLTVAAPMAYDPGATCPTFDRFLVDVTCGDADLAAFLMELTAYAMTGFTRFDMLAFFYGGGSNGKSTFIQTIERLLGPALFRILDNGILIGNRESSSDDYKRSSLEGARLAVVDEIPDGKKLRTEELKKMSGGDSIQARNPYERPRTFKPTHKIWMAGNHKPTITSMDHGTWRRIVLIPWNAKFTGAGESRDERIAAHLDERAGILNRLLAAWQDLKTRGGFALPAAVRDASAAYRTDSDQVGTFASERLMRCEGMDVRLSIVFDEYRRWCETNGEQAVAATPRKFSDDLRRVAYASRKKSGNRAFVENVAILAEE